MNVGVGLRTETEAFILEDEDTDGDFTTEYCLSKGSSGDSDENEREYEKTGLIVSLAKKVMDSKQVERKKNEEYHL